MSDGSVMEAFRSAAEARSNGVAPEEDAVLVEGREEGGEDDGNEPEESGASAAHVPTQPTSRLGDTTGLEGDNRKVYDQLLKKGVTQHGAFRAAHSFKKYAAWCKAHGFTEVNAPPNALTQFAREVWKPQGQNSSAIILLGALDAAREVGIAASPQSYEAAPKKPKGSNGNGTQPMQWATGVEYNFPNGPPSAPPGMIWTSYPNHKGYFLVSQPAAESKNAAEDLLRFNEQPQAPQPAAQPAPQAYQPPPQPEPTPQPQYIAPQARPAPSALRQPVKNPFPTGGKVRIYKISTGFEGNGIAPGQRIGVGEYMADDVSTEGTIRDFIQRNIVSQCLKPGMPDTIFVVERLDDRRNVIATYDFPFSAPVLSGAGGAPTMPMGGFAGTGLITPGPTQWGAPVAPFAPPPSANDKFIEYLMDKEKEQQRQFEELRKQLTEQHKGADPVILSLLIEKARPAPVDWGKVIAEYKGKESASIAAPTNPAADLFAASPPPPLAENKVVDALTRMTDRVMDMAERDPAPPPAMPVQPQGFGFMDFLQSPLGLKLVDKVMGEKEDGTAKLMIDMLRDEVKTLREKLDKPPEKSKGVAEMLGDLKALNQTYEEIRGGGDDRPSGLVEVASMFFENADKIGEMVGAFMGKAPTLPKSPKKELPAGQPQQATGAPQAPQKVPEEAQKAIIAMVNAPGGEDGDQVIGDAIFTLVLTLRSSPEPFPRLAQAIITGFLDAESKPELRALVTGMLSKCGARKLITDAVVEKIADVLWRHYTFLFEKLNEGKTKVLRDAAPPAKAASVPAPAAPAVAVMTPAPVEAKGKVNAEEDEDEGEDEREEPAVEAAPAKLPAPIPTPPFVSSGLPHDGDGKDIPPVVEGTSGPASP